MVKLFDVYTLFDIEPIAGDGSYVFDKIGNRFLDFYGGHAVISIGHNHPHFIKKLGSQLHKIIFYSNSVQNALQKELCIRLDQVAKLKSEYDLFLVNSGAEANENALKVASFYNNRTKVISLKKGFHGRTSAAVNVTDNQKIIAPINRGFEVDYFDIDDLEGIQNELLKGDTCAVIIEPIQGIGGINVMEDGDLITIKNLCDDTDTVFIADEIQCGYGRSGEFFAFQKSGIQPDIITMAKGMGNGFPIGGLLIKSSKFKPSKGMLGTTFGGNHLACSAAIAVLEVIISEKLMDNAKQMGDYLIEQLNGFEEVKEVKGRGLMLGLDMGYPIKELRKQLLYKENVFTGSASDPNVLRLLPPLTINQSEVDVFLQKFKNQL